jgi:hypothetical protein
MREQELVDGAARWVRALLGSPAGRDLAGVFFVGCMVAAVALWQPLLGLFVLGVLGLAMTLLVSFMATAPEAVPEREPTPNEEVQREWLAN